MKTVLLPIKVPSSHYCYNGSTGEICAYFNTIYGPDCSFFGSLRKGGEKKVLKLRECIQLKEVDK